MNEKPYVAFLNPDNLSQPNGFSHVSVCDPSRLAFVSGQVAYDNNGSIVGVGDLSEQVRQVFRNLEKALHAVESDFRHVVKFTFFVKNLNPARMSIIRAVRAEFLDVGALPASTMIGISALAKDELELEVEAYAIVP